MTIGTPGMESGRVMGGCAVPLAWGAFGAGVRAVVGERVVVEWETDRPGTDFDGGRLGADEAAMEVWRDGELIGVDESGAGTASVSGLRAGAEVNLGLGAVSRVEARGWPGGYEYFVARATGRRVCLTWEDAPAESDFDGYVIYWDAGAGGTPGTVLATVRDRSRMRWVTSELAAGTYRFAIAYRDSVGNISAAGSAREATVGERPLAVTGLAVSYDQGTRRATLTWTNPAGQASDVVALVVFDNVPVHGGDGGQFGEHANSDFELRAGSVGAAAEEWESQTLWGMPGGGIATWRWSVRAMLSDGTLGAGEEVALAVVMDGSDLVEADVPPAARPVLERVEALAGATWRATWRTEDLGDVDEWRVVEDGVEVATVETGTRRRGISWTSGARVDGTTYEVRVRAYAGSAWRESNAISVTVDGAAPTGDGVLVAEVCD